MSYSINLLMSFVVYLVTSFKTHSLKTGDYITVPMLPLQLLQLRLNIILYFDVSQGTKWLRKNEIYMYRQRPIGYTGSISRVLK